MLYTAVFTCTVNETGGVVYSSVYLYSQWDWGCCIQQCLPVQSVGLGVMYTAVFTCTVNETGLMYTAVFTCTVNRTGLLYTAVFTCTEWDWG